MPSEIYSKLVCICVPAVPQHVSIRCHVTQDTVGLAHPPDGWPTAKERNSQEHIAHEGSDSNVFGAQPAWRSNIT